MGAGAVNPVPAPPPGFQMVGGDIPPPPPGFQMQGAAPPPAATPSLMDEIGDILFPQNGQVMPEAPKPPLWQRIGETGLGIAGDFASGVNTGLAALAGAPVDLVNVSPMLLNLLPGEQGMRPFSPDPVGGSGTIEDLFRVPSDVVNAVAGTDLDTLHEPQAGMAGRFAHRIGQEVGAVIPFVGVGSRLARGARGLEEMSGAERWLAAPMRKNPVGAVQKEAAFATASGTGAQTANELFTADNRGTPVTDLGGSIAGVASLSGAGGIAGILRNLAAGATNNPRWMDDIAGQAVVDQIINNSTMMGEQAEPFILRGLDPQLDTTPLADRLRAPAAVEQAIPGYTADIGVRADDPLLKTFVQDANARSAGAGNAARTRNNAAVNATVDALAPAGNPGDFRLALQQGVDAEIASLFDEEMLARAASDEARSFVLPQMASPAARGASIRSGLQDAKTSALDDVSELYAAIEGSGATIDPAALAQRFGAVDAGLPVNDQLRFRPQEADTPGRLLPEEGDAAPVPFREATAIRSGLSNEAMKARAANEPRRASIAGQYRDELDRFLAEALDPETAAAYEAANRARFDVGQRFEDRGALPQTLAQTERGDFRLPDEAVPRQYVQPDSGRVSDYGALMREAGTDQRVRDGIADQVLADAQPYLDNPDRLDGFLRDHGVVLNDFPELRQKLEKAGVQTRQMQGATAARTAAERDLTTPGRSPEADYLYKSPGAAFGNDESRRSISRVVNSADPRAATRQLLDRAGSTDPEAAVNLRTALWEEVSAKGKNSATDLDGQDVWNARKVRDTLNDPKFSAVAEELWRDDPDDLASIREVFDALEAATPGRARAPGSSGTAQSIQGKLDPSMTATSIASRARSVKRGQMSPVIASIDLLSTYLRNKSTQVQARAIDTLAAQVVNNPGLAADLLEKFNPADFAVKKQMLTQRYGARVSQVLTLLDAANNEDALGGEEGPAPMPPPLRIEVDGK